MLSYCIESLLLFLALVDEGLQTDVGAQAADRTGNVVGKVALEYPQDAATVAGRHVRGQPAAIVGLPDQRELVGSEAAAGAVRIPRVHRALAAVPEVHCGLAVRAQQHHFFGLRSQVGDGALFASLSHVARGDRVHPVAGQIRQVQHVATRLPLRQRNVQHVALSGAIVRDRFWQYHAITAVRGHVPNDNRSGGRVRHVHECSSVVPVISRDIVQPARRAHQTRQIYPLDHL